MPALLLLAALVGLVLVPDAVPLQALRALAFDAYQMAAPRVRRSAPATIVAIDEASLASHGQWPWPRTLLARLLERIGEAGPAAVGVDIVMAEADRLSPDRLASAVAELEPDLAARLARLPGNDAVLAGVIARLPVVVGVGALKEASPAGAARAARRTPVHEVGDEPRRFVQHFAGELRSVPPIDGAARGHGLINHDPEGRVVRRLPLVAAIGDDLVPTLGLEMVRVASGQPALRVRVGPNGVRGVTVGDLDIPTQADGAVWLHYTPRDSARHVSAAAVLSGRVDPVQLEHKLVLVGVTAEALGDRHPTPVDPRMAGVEIHAQLLESIFDRSWLVRPDWGRWAEAAALAALGLVLIVAVSAWPAWAGALLAAAMVVAVVGLGFLAYLARGLLLDAALPAAGLVLVFAAATGSTLAEAQRHRRALRQQLAAEREAAARVAGELEAARRIQMGILPDPRVVAGDRRIELYAHMQSARVVGGDLYDFFWLDADRLFLLVGDVSGKGVPGSLFMAVSKALCKSSALRRTGDLTAAVAEANAEISRDNPEALFVTAWAGVLDATTGRLEYCNAGHEPACLLDATRAGTRNLAEGGGPPLCVVDDFPYATATQALRPGQTLCLVTDGVTEAMSPTGELYGRARLEAVLAALPADAPAEAVGEAVRADVARHIGDAEPSDDITIVALRWRGPARP